MPGAGQHVIVGEPEDTSLRPSEIGDRNMNANVGLVCRAKKVGPTHSALRNSPFVWRNDKV